MGIERYSLMSIEGHDDRKTSLDELTTQGKRIKRHSNVSQQLTLTIHVKIHYHVDASKPPSRKRMRSEIIKKFKKKLRASDKKHENTDSELQYLLDETHTEVDQDSSTIRTDYEPSNPSNDTDIDSRPSAQVHQMLHFRPYVFVKWEVFDPERILGIWYNCKPRTNLSSANLDEPTFLAFQTNLAAEVAHSTDVLIRILNLYERLTSKVRGHRTRIEEALGCGHL